MEDIGTMNQTTDSHPDVVVEDVGMISLRVDYPGAEDTGRMKREIHQDSESNVALEENQDDCSSDCLAGNCSQHDTISRRRSESWDDLKEELANIENHNTKADKGKCITQEPERNEHSPEFHDRLDEEYDETIYKVDFPSKLCGEKFQLEVIDDEYHDEIEITVNRQARVLVADGVVENGVIHVIDRVLLPKGIKLPKILWHDFQRHAF
ncbi:hypothetical protein K7432_015172 [Basidiobolus ranarum]|uniref:FAS1 domain-containing protein n=1 Tax=Basidiobolus ranarum TaxID=34480 RepID=A0ABR2VNI0_9FUNG